MTTMPETSPFGKPQLTDIFVEGVEWTSHELTLADGTPLDLTSYNNLERLKAFKAQKEA